jgi:hypothetical protein
MLTHVQILIFAVIGTGLSAIMMAGFIYGTPGNKRECPIIRVHVFICVHVSWRTQCPSHGRAYLRAVTATRVLCARHL